LRYFYSQITMQDLRRSRMDLPAKPKDDREIPHKPFGTITFPTLQELENRQNGQIHINDESEVLLLLHGLLINTLLTYRLAD